MSEEIKLREYPCPVCGSAGPEPLYAVKGFSIVRCRTCRMVYVDPRIPDEAIFDIYRNQYFQRSADGYGGYELIAPMRKRTFARWYRTIRPFLPAGRGNALDVGCAAGYFIDVLTEDGWTAEGIELDLGMAEDLVRRGYRVSNVPLESFAAARKFKLITLFDVIEHLPGVAADMTKIADLLDDDGILAVVTPNVSSPQRKLMGRRWFQFKPREHIHYFSPATLGRLASRHGLTPIHVSPSGQYADFGFLGERLKKYGYAGPAAVFRWFMKAFRLAEASRFVRTGSMLVVLKKTAPGA